MRRKVVSIVVVLSVLALVSFSFAHVRAVGGGGNWVGGPTLPAAAQGEGLMPNPFGVQAPAHMKGLPTACHALRGNPSVQDFWGPPHPETCRHGP